MRALLACLVLMVPSLSLAQTTEVCIDVPTALIGDPNLVAACARIKGSIRDDEWSNKRCLEYFARNGTRDAAQAAARTNARQTITQAERTAGTTVQDAWDAILPQPARCGDGVVDDGSPPGNVDLGEGCDDGNRTAGDGCDPQCQVEP